MVTILDDMARGCGRSAVIRVIAAVIVIPLACGLICIPTWGYTQFDLGLWALILPAVLFLLLLFGGSGVYMWVVLSQRKRMLDAAFVPLGLHGKAYQSFFRQYHGERQGRRVEVYLARGPRLEIEVNTALKTRLGITGPHADTRFFAGIANQRPMTLEDPALSDLLIFPHDEAWTRRLFVNPEAASLIKRLVKLAEGFSRQQVILRPGTFRLLLTGNTRMFSFELDPDQVGQWVDDLLGLAAIAERLPDPTVIDELSSLEHSTYRLRARNPYLALWFGLGTLAFFVVTALCVAGFVVLLTMLE